MNIDTRTEGAITEPVVLVVDDDPAVLEALSTLLAPRLEPAYRVEMAASAEEGLELLDGETKDRRLALAAVISDEKMPGRTGVELLIELRGREEHRGGGRIIITGYAGLESAKRAINEAEVDKYLPKPWDEAELLDTLGDMLARFERARGWDACDVVTVESIAEAREDVRTIRRDWNDYAEMRLHEGDDRDPSTFDRSNDDERRFAVVRRWTSKGREAQAFLRLQPADGGAWTVDEWAALPTRDDRRTLELAHRAALAAGGALTWDIEGGVTAEPIELDTAVAQRWSGEQRLCACHQTGCVAADYAKAQRSYQCPLDRIEKRLPAGFPIDGKGA